MAFGYPQRVSIGLAQADTNHSFRVNRLEGHPELRVCGADAGALIAAASQTRRLAA